MLDNAHSLPSTNFQPVKQSQEFIINGSDFEKRYSNSSMLVLNQNDIIQEKEGNIMVTIGKVNFGNYQVQGQSSLLDVNSTTEKTNQFRSLNSSHTVPNNNFQPVMHFQEVTKNGDAFEKSASNSNLIALNHNDIIQRKERNIMVKTGTVNFENYQVEGKAAALDVHSRAGKTGQFLNWINVLPSTQLKNLDSLYNLAAEAKKGGYTDVAILGIGGSRHTTESMIKMLGADSNVHFYSGIDPDSFNRFTKNLDLNKTKFLVVSKSGGTLETTVAYESAKKLLQEKLGREDVSDMFIAMTDQSAEKSKLRQIVNKGDIKLSGVVHDDVGGRFSIFDDATIFTMAYAGISKDTTKKMLEASLAAQKEFSNPDIKSNEALQLAAFNVDSKKNGKNKHFVEYFGDAFSGATLWEKQMKNESLKSHISTDTNIGPGYLHYNAESDLDSNNKDSFYTFVYVKPQDKPTTALLQGAMKAYKAQHPVSEIVLNDLSPETIARFIELKHFETMYTGNMIRREAGNVTPNNQAVPEVLQPNVEIYKKEVRNNLSAK